MKIASKSILITILLLLSLIVQAGSSANAQELVLVSATKHLIKPLTMLEIRQLYLGLTITKDKTKLRPLRNYTEEKLKHMFLQKVVFLSSRTYERQLMRRIFATGSHRPKIFDNKSDLIEMLKRQPGTFTIMLRSNAMTIPGLSIVQAL